MKGIIVDKKGRYAVVLTGNGSFIKIKNKVDYKIGYEVEFKQKNFVDTRLLRKISAVAAVSLFTLGLSYGAYSYTLPYSYVDVDINPSIELTANVFDVIIKTETFNEDGKQLLAKNNIKFKTLDAGISELMDSAIQQGYLKEDADNTVLLTITSKNDDKSEKLKESLESSTSKTLSKGNIKSSVLLQESTTQKHDEAKDKDKNISPGKMSLIEKAMKDEPQLKLDELKDASLKDIMKHIQEDEKEEMRNTKENGKTQGNGKFGDKKAPAWTPEPGTGKVREDNDEETKGNGNKGSDKKNTGNGNNRNNTGNNRNDKDEDDKQTEGTSGFGPTPGYTPRPFFSTPGYGIMETSPQNWLKEWEPGEDRQDNGKGDNGNNSNNKVKSDNGNNNEKANNKQKDKN